MQKNVEQSISMGKGKQQQGLTRKQEVADKPLQSQQQQHRLFKFLSKKRARSEQAATAPEVMAKGHDMPQTPPAVLTTPLAMALWQKAQEMGWVDEQNQPLIVHWQAALLAERMAALLNIPCKWLVFGKFWHIKYLKNYRVRALNQQGAGDFMCLLNQLNETVKSFLTA